MNASDVITTIFHIAKRTYSLLVMTELMKYVAYYRVSTQKQGASGLGLEAQKASVTQYLAGREVIQLDEFIEIESGKREDRIELQKALRRCRLTGATLVIAKLDRLSRNIEFIAKLQSSKVEFTCVDMPEANTLTIGMMAVLAQYEREMISERTKAGLQAAKARGQILGNPRIDECRCTDTTAATKARQSQSAAHNADIVALIGEFEATADRVLTVDELVDELNGAGYKTIRGCEFTRIQVYRARAQTQL